MTRPIALTLLLMACSACGSDSESPHGGADSGAGPRDDATSSDSSASTTDPADDGTFTVVESATTIPGSAVGRMLPTKVFAPSTGTARPLVIVSPGYQLDAAQYTSYARHLATWGFVVVLTNYADTSFFPDHAKLAADVKSVIDWALGQSSLAIDATKIATAGHSLGGKISIYAAALDSRVRAVVAWDPVDSTSPSVAPEMMTSLTAALAVVGETTNGSGGGMPCAPSAENFQQFYAAAASPSLELTIVGADHMDWVDDPSCGFCGFCTAGSADAERSRRATRRLDVAWLRRQLLADMTMTPWLSSPPELANGLVAIRSR